MSKVTQEQLIDLAHGRLSAQVAAALRTQIAADPALSAEFAAVEELISLMRSDTSVDAPEHVIARAVRLMRRPVAPPAPGLLQRILAVLKYDSAPQRLPSGLRSAEATERNLAYSAAAWELDFQIAPRAGRWQLRGQLLGPELAGSVALSSSTETVTTETNELGEFTLPPVAAGSYTLRLQIGTHEIVVESLELGLSALTS